MAEDLKQLGDNKNSNSGEIALINYTDEWKRYYDEEEFDWPDERDVDRKMTRHGRYSNLPYILAGGGIPTTLVMLEKVLQNNPDNEKLKINIAKYRKFADFIKAQMSEIGITEEEAKEHNELVKKDILTADEFAQMKSFVNKMERLIQNGVQAGFKPRDLV